MPTYRKLHTKIIDSYDFAEMPNDFTRVMWMLMIVVVDSEGRAIDNPSWIKSRMFPLRSDISDREIDAALEWLSVRSMIVRYTANGRKYFYVPNFKKYQTGTEREAKSVLPSHDQLMSNSVPTQEEITTNSTATVVASVSASDNVYVRPNVFSVYEKEIGPLTSTIADELLIEEKENAPGYVEDAIKEASRSNRRSLKYIQGILRNWREKGKSDSSRSNGNFSNLPEFQVAPDGRVSL